MKVSIDASPQGDMSRRDNSKENPYLQFALIAITIRIALKQYMESLISRNYYDGIMPDFHEELEKRERLVQTFLTIGGFFVAFTDDKFKDVAIFSFVLYLFFIMQYYIFILKGFNTLINSFAVLSSIPYSFLVLILFYSHAPNSWSASEFWFVFIAQFWILTFSLLSPETNNRIIEFFKKISEAYPKLTKAVGWVLIVIIIVWFINYVLSRVKFT